MHKNFPTPGGILLSIIPRLDAGKTQGKHENSIIFTSQRCYISEGTCLITIQSAFNTLYISKYKINRFFKKQFVFSAKAAESVAFEKGSHCSDWPVHWSFALAKQSTWFLFIPVSFDTAMSKSVQINKNTLN